MGYILDSIEGLTALINAAKEDLRPGLPTIAVYVPIPERFLPLSVEVYGPLFVHEANAVEAFEALNDPRGSKLVHHFLAAHKHLNPTNNTVDLAAFAEEIGLPLHPKTHRKIEADIFPREGGAVLRLMDKQEHSNIVPVMVDDDGSLDWALNQLSQRQVERGSFDTHITARLPGTPLGWLFSHPGYRRVRDQIRFGDFAKLSRGEGYSFTFSG